MSAYIAALESKIEKLKELIEARKQEREKLYFDDDDRFDQMLNIEIEQAKNDRKLLVEKIRECDEQAEYIAALESKIEKLEELMRLKDAKIAKLSRRGHR